MAGIAHDKKPVQKGTPTQKKSPKVSNVAKLDPNHPIPIEYGSMVHSVVGAYSYLPFLAPNDDYAKDLLEARLLSDTHNACVTTKKDYCAGKGFHDADGKPLPENITEWFSSMNRKNQPASKINRIAFENFFTWGNVPIEIVRFTVAGKKKLFVYAHNLLEWRLGKPDEDGFVTYAVHSKLFLRQGYISAEQLKTARQVPVYSPLNSDKDNWVKDDKGAYRTIIWYKNDVSGFDHYGLPSAVSSMIYQLLEYSGARYNLDNLDNNMVLGGLLALKGNLSQDEANRIAKEIIKTHTGNGKRGRVAVVASEEGIDGSDYHDYDTSKDGSFKESDDQWTQKIILANQWDAVLAGIISPSTLGKGSGFITKILEIKQNTVIRPAQEDLMQNVWNDIFKIADQWMNLGLSNYSLTIENSIDISGLTDVDITPAVQINEVRAAKGLPEDPKMDGVYMKATGPQQQQKGGDNVQD